MTTREQKERAARAAAAESAKSGEDPLKNWIRPEREDVYFHFPFLSGLHPI